jgi:hypothetical protein
MSSLDLLTEFQKLAGIQPRKLKPQSGTRAKLAKKQRPKKALRARGRIQSRSDSSERKIASRQKNPKRTMYKSKAARVSRLQKKLSFQRKGEEVESVAERMRTLLQT